jgi:selenocysteine lyase/cysteine desulfurase
MNAYGTQPWPRPDEISLSSSTASTISPRGYAAARTVFERLENARERGRFAPAFADVADELRGTIRRAFDLPDAEVVLSPSGTDGAMLALFLARGLLRRPVTSIVVGADESGSGVPAAAAGRHFAAAASGGRAVVPGAPIAGLACAVVRVAGRDAGGRPRRLADIDADVAAAAEDAIRAGNGVVLHAMDHSKLGGEGPSLACLREICALVPGAVQVVVDACQARVSRARLAWYLDQGFLVLITGSKFFAGPPLCGALLIPERLRAAVGRIAEVPAGLADYTARDDWPPCFGLIRAQLSTTANVGQMLRWRAAVAEIRAYFAVPELFRRVALAEFAAAAARHLARYHGLQPLLEPERCDVGEDNDEFAARTIFPFIVVRDGRPLSLADTRTLHQALNMDGSALDVTDPVAATPCHLGQPVPIEDGAGGMIGALRISADARLVSDSWAGGGDLMATERLLDQLGRIGTALEKLRFLLGK